VVSSYIDSKSPQSYTTYVFLHVAFLPWRSIQPVNPKRRCRSTRYQTSHSKAHSYLLYHLFKCSISIRYSCFC